MRGSSLYQSAVGKQKSNFPIHRVVDCFVVYMFCELDLSWFYKFSGVYMFPCKNKHFLRSPNSRLVGKISVSLCEVVVG